MDKEKQVRSTLQKSLADNMANTVLNHEQEKKKKTKLLIGALIAVILICVIILFYTQVHTWESANCTLPETCAICGKTRGTPLGHAWSVANCTTAKTCTVCGKIEGDPLGHVWKGATCTEQNICLICGEREGTALGHSWVGATCTERRTCSSCGLTEGSPLGHTWVDATCTEKRTCSSCGQTEGSPLGHTWMDVTCTLPRMCSFCGETSGNAKGHTWTNATFEKPKICTICGETEGTAISYQNISVKDEVAEIRRIYNLIYQNSENKKYKKVSLRQGVIANYDDEGNIAFAAVYRGTDGIGAYSKTYSRTYYFSDNKLIFAFYEGEDAHRLYFYEGLLMRWNYRAPGADAVYHDFEFSDEYYMWEQFALSEAKTFF